MKRQVLIVAGGKGLRMGGELPKQFIPLAGKPVLMHTLETFHRWDATAELVVVLPFAHHAYWQMLCREIGCRVPHRIATGGETRFHSVRNGLALLEEAREETLVGIHDGVRPFVSEEVIERCFAEAARSGAAVPCLPVIESLREALPEGGSRSVDRSSYVTVQTPQVFRREWLSQAYRQDYLPSFTDDASVVEHWGRPVTLVAGNRENIKLTTPFDLRVAEVLMEGSYVNL